MEKILIEVDEETISFFQGEIDDTMPLDELLSKMLKLFSEMLRMQKMS